MACVSNAPALLRSVTVSNAGSFNTTLTNVSVVSDNGTSGDTNDDAVFVVGTLTNGETFTFSSVSVLPSHTTTNTIVALGGMLPSGVPFSP